MKRLCLNLIFLISIMVAFVSIAKAVEANWVTIDLQIQKHSYWCWAASAHNALKNYGQNPSQASLVNWLLGRSDCNTGTVYDWNHPCNVTVPNAGEIREILLWKGVSSYGYHAAPGFSWVKNQINNTKRPFIIIWQYVWGGHAIVGYGYIDLGIGASGQYTYYMDSGRGEGWTYALHSWVQNGNGHTWTDTVMLY